MNEQFLKEYSEILEFSKKIPAEEFKLSTPGFTYSIDKFILMIKLLVVKIHNKDIKDIIIDKLKETLPSHTDGKTTFYNRINYWKKLEAILELLQKELDSPYINDNHTKLYVSISRIKDLSNLKQKYDNSKLVRLCEELNFAYSDNCFLTCGMLVRAIIDHIPPIFNFNSFTEFANNYKCEKSFKALMQKLDDSLRKIADLYLHNHIRTKENLPEEQQVNFTSELDVLLGEIIRVSV